MENLNPQSVMQLLNSLKETEGWKTLQSLMRSDLKKVEKNLCEGEYETIEDRNRDMDKATGLRGLIEAPEYYIRILQAGEPIENDPYYQSREDIERDKDH